MEIPGALQLWDTYPLLIRTYVLNLEMRRRPDREIYAGMWSPMRQTPTFSMSRRMVQAIAQVAGRRGESMSAVVRDAVRAYIRLDDDDRPLSSSLPSGTDSPPEGKAEAVRR